MTDPSRQSTGIPGLDELLGGGLLPGTLTVVVGATGIGKTQFGLQFARAGLDRGDEDRSGVIFDMNARGDSQSHVEYAKRMFDWQLHCVRGQDRMDLEDFFAIMISRSIGEIILKIRLHRNPIIIPPHPGFFVFF